jgi:tetratricopeptide (TPR) repeat protein
MLSVGNDFAKTETIAASLIEKNLKMEMEQVVLKLEGLADTPEKKGRLGNLRKSYADLLFNSGDYVRALEQFRKLTETPEILVKISVCCRQAGDFDTAIKTLNECLKQVPKTDKMFADIKLEILTTLSLKKDRKALIVEAYQLLYLNDQVLDTEVAQKINVLAQSAVTELLESKNISDLKAFGKKAIPFLLEVFVQESKKSYRAQILEIANAVTQTSYSADILNDAAKSKEALNHWKEWLKNNR